MAKYQTDRIYLKICSGKRNGHKRAKNTLFEKMIKGNVGDITESQVTKHQRFALEKGRHACSNKISSCELKLRAIQK